MIRDCHSAVARSNEEKLKISFPFFSSFSTRYYYYYYIIFKIYSTSGSLSKQQNNNKQNAQQTFPNPLVPLVLLHPARSFTPCRAPLILTQVKPHSNSNNYKNLPASFFSTYLSLSLSLSHPLPWKEKKKHKQYLIHFIFLATSCC